MLNFKEGRSDRHLRDIAGILAVSGAVIDAGYVDDWSRRLGLGEIWAAIRRRAPKE
jgi:hypothetical protein